MADQHLLELLFDDIFSWNKWREEQPEEREINFEGVDFKVNPPARLLRLHGMAKNLAGASLKGAILKRTSFKGTDLRGTDVRGIDWKEIDLTTGADLSRSISE